MAAYLQAEELFNFPDDGVSEEGAYCSDGCDSSTHDDDSESALAGDFPCLSFPSPSASWSSLDDGDDMLQAAADDSTDWRFASIGLPAAPAAPIARAMRRTNFCEELKSMSSGLSLMDVVPSSIGCGVSLQRELFTFDVEAGAQSDDEEDSFGRLLADSIARADADAMLQAAVRDGALTGAVDAKTMFPDVTYTHEAAQQAAWKPKPKHLAVAIVKTESHDEDDGEDTKTLGSARECRDGAESVSDNSSENTLRNSPARSSGGDVSVYAAQDDGDAELYDDSVSSDEENGMDDEDVEWGYGKGRGSGSKANRSSSKSALSPTSATGAKPKRPRAKAAPRPPKPVPTTPHGRPYTCEFCPAGFIRKHDLKRHERIHLGIKPYSCATCSKSFSRLDAMNRHSVVTGCRPAR
ncbi:hypothetical protein DFJ74DRAFT_688750 [Hyaloraphidium curvatum]|nr:hypothetical protein DFJ74DRAFT_688750 [Hyaloraphidium curvatum]